MEKKQTYRRGDIYLAELGSYFGSEQGGTRPVLILQNDVGNRYSPTLIVAPLTGNPQKSSHLPTHCRIEAREKLLCPSVVMLEQITTIDKSRVLDFMGRLDDNEMKQVKRAVEISLGLRETGIPQKEPINLTLRDKYNGSGCLDMTAYLAMRNVERRGR